MIAAFKNHPFPVEAQFERSVVLTFAVPEKQLQSLIPECLKLDTFNDQWAFVAVAMVQTNSLRPKGLPQCLGLDFLLIGYRIFVRYTNKAGKRLRGLYILRSETNKKSLEWLGGLFTRYSYHTTDIFLEAADDKSIFRSATSGFIASVESSDGEVPLPESSPFTCWKEARRFAGPLPFTFSYDPGTRKVLIVEGVREAWTPRPVKVERYHIPYLQTLGLHGSQLTSAFEVRNIPYYWKRGRTEIWNA